MKNLSFTEFMKDLEQQNEGATETEVVKVETFTDFCSQQKISLAHKRGFQCSANVSC